MVCMNGNKILCILFGLLLGCISVFALEPGDKAPPFVNLDLNKKHVLSKNYLGKGWLILDFFATDCEGCKKEIPVLERVQQELEEQGLKVIVFATDPQGTEVVNPFFKSNPTELTVLLDHYQVAVKKYGVTDIPSLFVVNPEGVVVHKEVGYREDLYEFLTALLAGGQQEGS
jgi:peroxiredoxin